jgi:RHS repeat-associated protein
METTVSVRRRSWVTRNGEPKEAWIADYVDQHGARHIKTFARKKDADRYHSYVAVDMVAGVHTADSASIMVVEAGRLWLESCEVAKLERATLEQYRRQLDLHITPLIGAVKLAQLTVPAVRAFEDRLRTDRSPVLVRKVLVSLSSIYEQLKECPAGSSSSATLRVLRSQWSGNNVETRFWDSQGAATTSLYDSLGRLRGMRSVDAGGANPRVSEFRYAYDRIGNLSLEQRVHEPLDNAGALLRTRAYKTDLLGRLAKWREGGLAQDSIASPAINPVHTDPSGDVSSPTDGEEWTMDLLGNWTTRTSGVNTSPPTDNYSAANPLNQYTNVTPAGGAQDSFTFDWLGQLRQDGRSNQGYAWDAFGRLSQAFVPGSPNTTIATYRYDAFNRRVEKTVGTGFSATDTTTRYLYDGWRAIEERALVDAGGGTKREVVRARYGFGLGLDEVVWMDRDLAGSGAIGSRYFLTHDALGSAAAVVADRTDFSQALNVVERFTYSAYGKAQVWTGAWNWQTGAYAGVAQTASSVGFPYLYTGQRLDAETGLLYFKNREYDPSSGRFLRRDPIGLAGGNNLYTYANSSPNQSSDSLGLFSPPADHFVDPNAPPPGFAERPLMSRRGELTIADGDQRADRQADQRCADAGRQADLQGQSHDLRQIGVEGGNQPKRFGNGGGKILHELRAVGAAVELQHSAHAQPHGQSSKLCRTVQSSAMPLRDACKRIQQPAASSASVRDFEQAAGLHHLLVAPSGVERPVPFAELRQPALGDRVFDFRSRLLAADHDNGHSTRWRLLRANRERALAGARRRGDHDPISDARARSLVTVVVRHRDFARLGIEPLRGIETDAYPDGNKGTKPTVDSLTQRNPFLRGFPPHWCVAANESGNDDKRRCQGPHATATPLFACRYRHRPPTRLT